MIYICDCELSGKGELHVVEHLLFLEMILISNHNNVYRYLVKLVKGIHCYYCNIFYVILFYLFIFRDHILYLVT